MIAPAINRCNRKPTSRCNKKATSRQTPIAHGRINRAYKRVCSPRPGVRQRTTSAWDLRVAACSGAAPGSRVAPSLAMIRTRGRRALFLAAGAFLACGRTELDHPVVVSAGHDAGAIDQTPDAATDGDASDARFDQTVERDAPADESSERPADAPADLPPADVPPDTGSDKGGSSSLCGEACVPGTSCVRGSYVIGQVLATERMPTGLAAGDFNGDGLPDLVVANKDSRVQQIFLGTRAGMFPPGRRLDAPEATLAVAVGDFDADGRLDLAFSVNFGLTIWKGDGTGNFRLTQSQVFDAFPVAMAGADLNRDGALDLALADYRNGDVMLLGGDGRGAFGQRGTIEIGKSPIFVAAADLDADTNMDLVVADYDASALSVQRGSGDGTTFSATGTYGLRGAPDAAALADFDLDGDLDVAVSSSSAGAVSVFWNDGRGGLGIPSHVAAGNGVGAVSAADINTDGRPDLVVRNIDSVIGTGNGSVSMLLGGSDGTFRQVQNIHMGSLVQSIVVLDVNGDAHSDLAVIDYIDDTLTILLWTDGYLCR